jgi:hypothetical protein
MVAVFNLLILLGVRKEAGYDKQIIKICTERDLTLLKNQSKTAFFF